MPDPVLRIYVEHRLARELTLRGRLCLGRSPDNDLVLDDPGVSAHHGLIERAGGGWTFRDLGSSNGSEAAAGPTLRAGDSLELVELTQIRVGTTVLEYLPGSEPRLDTPAQHEHSAGDATARGGQAQTGMASLAQASADRESVRSPTRPAPGTPGPQSPAALAPGRTGEAPRKGGGRPPDEARVATPATPPAPDERGAGRTTPAEPASPRPPPGPAASPNVRGVPSDPTMAPDASGVPGGPRAWATDPAGLHPRLLVVRDDDVATVPLRLPHTVIGRCDDCDVAIAHPSVSSHHAEITWRQGRFVVADLGSTNGTRLGLARLEQPAPLINGSHLILGAIDLWFVHDGPLGHPGAPQLDARGFLNWLRQRKLLTADQARRVLSEVGAGERRVEECLVSHGLLSPGAVSELRHNAGRRLMGLSDERPIALPPRLLWTLLFLLVLAAVVLAAGILGG